MALKIILVSRCAWTMFNFRRNIAKACQQQGHDVLCLGAASGDYGDGLKELGLRFEAIPLSGRSLNPLKDIETLQALKAIFRREKPDIVHNFTIKPVIYGTLAAKTAKVPKVFNTMTGLGQVFSEDGNRAVRWIVERLYQTSLTKGDFTFFQNADDAALFQRFAWFGDMPHSIVAGSGVDTTLFDPDRFAPRDTSKTVTFVMVTRLLREKGVIEFCEAARRIRKDFADAQFRLIGGPDLSSPSAIASQDLQGYIDSGDIEWCGAVDNVVDYLAQADVVVLPSYYREGVPRSLLEAGAMGKAIITTNWPGCKDAIVPGETGLLVPPKDTAALVAGMEKLLTEPEEIKRFGDAGYRYVRDNFDEKQIIDTTLAKYANSQLAMVPS